MQIIIDILKDVIECAKSSPNYYPTYYFKEIWKAIVNGTQIPKGHDRLMILSEDKLKENQVDFSFSQQKWISEVGLSNATVAIIEADTESEVQDDKSRTV